MSLRDKIVSSKITKFIYNTKWYLDTGTTQVTFIVSRLPELMAIFYFLEKLGIIIVGKTMILVILAGYLGVIGLGWTWKRLGLFDTERYTSARNDPVQKEILEAARRINNGR